MQTTTLLPILCAAVLTLPGLAQQPPAPAAKAEPAAPADQPAPARVALARALQELDALLVHLEAAQASAAAAVRQAQQAETQAKEAAIEPVGETGAELQARAADLAAAIAQRIEGLRELRVRVAAEVPASLRVAQEPLRAQILGASTLGSLADAQDALARIEEQLSGEEMRQTEGRDQLLGFCRYKLADTMRQRASQEIRAKGSDNDAEKMLQRAGRKYAEVLTTPDVLDSDQGSSLHAAALRRIVQVEVTLYDGYRQLSAKKPGARAYVDAANKHKAATEQAFDQLKRNHAEATLPDGQRMVDAARADVARYTR